MDLFDYDEDNCGEVLDSIPFHKAKTELVKAYRKASDAVQLKPKDEAMKLYESFVKGY